MEKTKQIVTDLYNSRYDDFGKDTVVLNCMNGTMKAHKTVLKSGNQYFTAMFNGDNEESRTNTINFRETSIEVMDIIIKYLYSQNLPDLSQLSQELARDLILEANKLQLTELFNKYWKALNSLITTKNFIYIWELCHTLNKPKSARRIMTFLGGNLSKIAKSEDLCNKNAKQLSNLITPDLVNELNRGQTTGLFNFILSWGSKKQMMKEKEVLSLLSKCDLKKLPDSYLSTTIKEVISDEIRELLNNEALRRWHESVIPPYHITMLHANSDGNCSRRKFSVRNNEWKHMEHCNFGGCINYIYGDVEGFPDQWIGRCDCEEVPTVLQMGFGIPDEWEEPGEVAKTTLFETANSTYGFFKLLGEQCYVSIKSDSMDTMEIHKEIYGDCKRLLLAIGTKLYFDVDQRSIKICDWKTRECRSIDKPPGNWMCFNCPSRLFETTEHARINIFFYDDSNRLLLFNIQRETWKKDEMSVDPNVNLNDVKFVSYDEGFFMICDSSGLPQMTIYSLRENYEIVKTTCIPNDAVNDENYFYVSLDDCFPSQ